MTHEYEGRYRTKHAPDTRVNANLARTIRQKAKGPRLTCSAAFVVARESGVSPAEVGQAADLLELKITACQLGLFGYGRERRIVVEPAQHILPELEQAIREGMVDGRLPCKEAWDIAERFGLSKMEIAAICESLGIRLSQCQLGTF